MVKEMMKLKREIEDSKTKMACMKSIDEERKEAGVYEGRKSMKTWANIAKGIKNEDNRKVGKSGRCDNEEE